ncbi:MAG: hypothetical protein M9913_18290 [Bryobacteraceae bacterium]|nr:hypothetical protein [Solibacteraceae bacterium]MCL4840760.1 hypothetical protein [Bryobacteraceae bacterium]MCO5352814.1 hypothetical protein [Bryobacteraceae bacterium]
MTKGMWIALGVLVFVALIGVMTFLMMDERQHRVEVCMAFNGRSNCSTASGPTQDEALRTATHAACTLIASGVTDSQACERGQPLSVKWLD